MDEVETGKLEAEALNSSDEGRTAVAVFPVFYWGVPLGVNFVKNFPWQGYERIYAVTILEGFPDLPLNRWIVCSKTETFALTGDF